MFKRNVLLLACMLGLNIVDVRAMNGLEQVVCVLAAVGTIGGCVAYTVDRVHSLAVYGTGASRLRILEGLQTLHERKIAFEHYETMASKVENASSILESDYCSQRAKEAFERYQEVLKMTSNAHVSPINLEEDRKI